MSAARKRLVVLTGAGISAESGIQTFRDSDGLWEQYRIEDVATLEAWERNPELVQQFYNERRAQLYRAEPNPGHIALAEAQEHFDVQIITQNIDDLHERAGSKHVLHLHGELKKSRSSINPNLIYDIEGTELRMGECAKDDGSQLRPHIVWFGEPVPNLTPAIELVQSADFFAVVGSSLNVYPAAGLIQYTQSQVPLYLVDPKSVSAPTTRKVHFIKAPASQGVPQMIEAIRKWEGHA